MRVLITGSDGYIGSVLSPLLIDNNHQVTGMDTGYFRDQVLYGNDNLNDMSPPIKDFRNIQVDELSGYDVVVHLAGLSNDPWGRLNPELTYKINHGESVLFAKKCKEAGVQTFIFSSSCSVYGIGDSELKTEESDPNPQTVYAKSKVLAERDISKLANHSFSPVYLRNATVYGPSPRMRFDIVLNNLSGLAWTTHKIEMISDGLPWRPLVHIEDVCEAFRLVIETPRETVHNEIFNIGDTHENYQVKDIANIVDNTFPDCETTLGQNADNRSYRVSFDKFHKAFPEFSCRHNVKQGAEELQSVYSSIGMQADTFFDKAYTRLDKIKYLRDSNQIDAELYWQSS